MKVPKVQSTNTSKNYFSIKCLFGITLIIVGVFLSLVDVASIVTEWILIPKVGSFVFEIWKEPPYVLYTDVYVYNYTNIDRFLQGHDTKLKLEQIGPLVFREIRYNYNLTLDSEKQVMRMIPYTKLKFIPEKSVIKNMSEVHISVPNLAVISLSTIAADSLPNWSNMLAAGLIRSYNSKLFLNITIQEYLWGYHDPLVSMAGTILPGWIDFGEIGILDRFYNQKLIEMEVNISDVSNLFKIVSYDNDNGLKEQGYTNVTGIPCNTISGTYEGIMLSPNMRRNSTIAVFRKQGCRIFPFQHSSTGITKEGLQYYRMSLTKDALDHNSDYACKCTEHCLPDGIIDISSCYYSFPIALSLPHFFRANQSAAANFVGMEPDEKLHLPFLDYEPSVGAPVRFRSSMQINMAVRTSPYNSITKPVDGFILPLIWFNMNFDEIPKSIESILVLRSIYAPVLIKSISVLSILFGLILLFYLFFCSSNYYYSLINTFEHKSVSSSKCKIKEIENLLL